MELVNCHCHTVRSGHGQGTVAEVVQAASDSGIATLALTENLPVIAGLDPDFGFSMDPMTVAAYREEVEEARAMHPEMTLLAGGELDWLGWLPQNLEHGHEVAAGYEYVLGSVHFIDGWEFDAPCHRQDWDEPGRADWAWGRYLQIWTEMACSDLPITTLAHPDLVKKFGVYPSYDLGDWNAEMARVAARSGRMVEVNTSGMRNPARECYPSLPLLTAFHAAGVDCTVGTDAHSPDLIASGLERAYAIMRLAGYTHLTVPTRAGDRRNIPLGD